MTQPRLSVAVLESAAADNLLAPATHSRVAADNGFEAAGFGLAAAGFSFEAADSSFVAAYIGLFVSVGEA